MRTMRWWFLCIWIALLAACRPDAVPVSQIATSQVATPMPASATPMLASTPSLVPTPSPQPVGQLVEVTHIDHVIKAIIEPLPVPQGDITAVSFVDGMHGWLAASDGVRLNWSGGETLEEKVAPTHSAIWHTDDGGQTWTPRYVTTTRITALDFISSTHGWAIMSGVPFATIDGGGTWQVIVTPSQNLFQRVAFVDAQHGWLAGIPTALWRTRDGGTHWQHLDTPCSSYDRRSWMSWIDAKRGLLLCGDAVNAMTQAMSLFTTSDSGTHWHQVEQDHTKDPSLQFPPDGYTSRMFSLVAGLSFVDARHGWLATSWALMVTDDGGVSWRLAKPPYGGGSVATADLFDEGRGVVVKVTDRAALVRTNDNGATWQQLFPAPTPLWPTLTFVDPRNGFGMRTSVDQSALLRTSDGGRTWQQIGRVAGPCDSSLFQIRFADLQNGWSLNECQHSPNSSNYLARTSDGGATWEPVALPESSYSSLSMIDSMTGYIIAYDNSRFLVTHDGWQTWTQLPSPPTEPGASSRNLTMIRDNLWWIENDYRRWFSANRGESWTYIILPERVSASGFLKSGKAWYWKDSLCQGLCTIKLVLTRDDGATWTQIDFGIIDTLFMQGFGLIDDQHGWLTAIGGHHYLTDDGGRTWKQVD